MLENNFFTQRAAWRDARRGFPPLECRTAEGAQWHSGILANRMERRQVPHYFKTYRYSLTATQENRLT